jgi:protoheme IX farnesyltransferase
MIGWAAVTGDITLAPVVLFLIIFLWTPPHFWALALYKQGDYAAAGIPMMPNVKGETHTKWEIVIYSVVLVAVTLLPQVIGLSGWIYTAVAAVTGLSLIAIAVRLLRTRDDIDMRKTGRRMFVYSSSYLFILFLALLTDRVFQMTGGI